MEGNANLSAQAITESLWYVRFQRWKYEDRIIIAFIKSV